jgi:hypothetical protein
LHVATIRFELWWFAKDNKVGIRKKVTRFGMNQPVGRIKFAPFFSETVSKRKHDSADNQSVMIAGVAHRTHFAVEVFVFVRRVQFHFKVMFRQNKTCLR